MRISKFKSVSDRVLEYQKEKRNNRIRAIARVALLVPFFVLIGFDIYSMNKREKSMRAPTWGDFVVTLPSDSESWKEWVNGKNSDGVPMHVIIDSQEWTIAKVDAFDDAVQCAHKKNVDCSFGIQAETYCNRKFISYINTEDPYILRMNLMHEIFHAGACSHGGDVWWNSVDPDRTEHPGVYHLGEFMSVFAHDNPTFMKWEMYW